MSGHGLRGSIFYLHPPKDDGNLNPGSFFVGTFELNGQNFVGFFEEKIRTPLFKKPSYLRGMQIKMERLIDPVI